MNRSFLNFALINNLGVSHQYRGITWIKLKGFLFHIKSSVKPTYYLAIGVNDFIMSIREKMENLIN